MDPTLKLILELVVLLGAIAMGARAGGVGMGLWGGVGMVILVFVFREAPGTIPGDVLLIILTVIMAASAMEAAGGVDFLVRVASAIIRKSPKHVTIIAPVVSYIFTFLAGTGHIFYPLLPVIYEVAMKGRVRPERPIAVSTIASQQAITASPVSAATAALIAILGKHGVGLPQILMICVPSTLIGVIVAALVQTRIGKELDKDPEYLRRVAAGESEGFEQASSGADQAAMKPLPKGAALSAYMFLIGVGLVVLAGLFPVLRLVRESPKPAPAAVVASAPATATNPATTVIASAVASSSSTASSTAEAEGESDVTNDKNESNAADEPPPPPPKPARKLLTLSMPMTIAIIMMALAALMLVFTSAKGDQIVKTKTCQAGITAVIGILGLAWLGETFIAANKPNIIGALTQMATSYPALFSLGLFVTSMLLYSQAATTQSLMPLGVSLHISPAALAGMFPAVNGYFFIPTYGTLVAAVNFDRSGTTRIGKYVLNHSFMIPGIISTVTAVSTGLLIGKIFF